MLNGIDVSHHQGIIDWQKVKDKGVVFAFIRATYGVTKDRQFARNWTEAKRVGIYRSAYGWVIDKMNQINNAAIFWDQIKNDPGEIPPAVDFESFGASKPGFSALQLYITEVERRCKRMPILYTSGGYWRQFREHKDQTWIKDYPLWIAHWTTLDQPTLPPPFDKWVFWQWIGDANQVGKEYGMESKAVDFDRFNGDINDFKNFIGGAIPQPPEHSGTIEQRLAKLESWAKTQGYNP